MKKILSILTAVALIAGACLFTTSCKNGEDGVDGTSAEALILKQTGNKWYKYIDSSDTDTKPTGTGNSITELLNDIYIKYDTSTGKLIVAAVGDNLYATTEKELSSGKWAASVVALRAAKKISTYSGSGNPYNGKFGIQNINNIANLTNFTAETLIAKLFDI